MRYATCLKGAALAASVIAAGVLMNGTASADVLISGYTAPSYGGPIYYYPPGNSYYHPGPVGSPEASNVIAPDYAMPVAGPYAYRYVDDYGPAYGYEVPYGYPYRGYIPADDQSFSGRVDQ
jgi:hypothetical protein